MGKAEPEFEFTEAYSLVQDRIAVSQNPSASSAIISRLSTDAEHQVRENIASHASTSPEILRKLAQDKEGGVRRRVASNRQTPSTILEAMLKDEDDWVRDNASRNPNMPEGALRKLAQHTDWTLRQNSAQNPKMPSDKLLALSKDREPGEPGVSIRHAVAMHPGTPEIALIELAADADGYVRRGVAENPNTPHSFQKHS